MDRVAPIEDLKVNSADPPTSSPPSPLSIFLSLSLSRGRGRVEFVKVSTGNVHGIASFLLARRGDTVDINKRYLSSIYAKRLDRVNENKPRRS